MARLSSRCKAAAAPLWPSKTQKSPYVLSPFREPLEFLQAFSFQLVITPKSGCHLDPNFSDGVWTRSWPLMTELVLRSVNTHRCNLAREAFEPFRSSRGKLSCRVVLAFACTLLAESLIPIPKSWDFLFPVPLGKEQFGLTKMTSCVGKSSRGHR